MRKREWEKEACVIEMTERERARVHDKQKKRERDNK